MARYPDTPRPQSPYNFRANRPTVSGGPGWAPQDRPLTFFGLGEADLTYQGRSWTDIMVLYNFFESVRGAAGRFTFVDFNGNGRPGQPDYGVQWSSLFVAKADGVTLSWDLPTFALFASPAPVIYENGASKTSAIITSTPDYSVAYNLTVGAGTDGVDLLTATASLAAVTTAPSPATSGLSLVADALDGSHFPTAPFYMNVWPAATAPTPANIETVQVTNVTVIGGPPYHYTLTIVRAQNGTLARTVVVGDQVAVPPGATIIMTCDAWCRRALRRAKFTTMKNPFVYAVPANYSQGTVTIVEVRR